MVSDEQILRDALLQQFDFHFHETRRLIELALSLPSLGIDAKDRYSHGGLRSTIEHILGSDGYWRGMLSEKQGESVSEAEPSSNGLEAYIALNEGERAKWEQFLRDVDDGWLRTEVVLELTFGNYRLTPGQAMQHLILHGQIHHGEMARLLTETGLSPGDVDYFDFVARRV